MSSPPSRRLLIVDGQGAGWALEARAVQSVEGGHRPTAERTLDVAGALGLPADGEGTARTLTVASARGLLRVHIRGTVRVAEVATSALLSVPRELRASRLLRASTAVLMPEDGPAVFVLDPEQLHALSLPGARP